MTKPGQWYLDQSAHRMYYVPLPGQDMAHATVVAPQLQTLVSGAGTATAPIHDITFRGITFSYATWLEPSSTNGYSSFQAGTYLTGTGAYRNQGACDSPQASCPYAAYDQIPGNVTFTHDQRITFSSNTFAHLGAAGLALGDASQDGVVAGNLFTDTSGGGLTIGGVDMPQASGPDLTSGNQVHDNYFHAVAAEYQDCAAIFVGYAQYTTIEHNQIDDVPYSGISIGWGGWLERFPYLGPLSNYSRGNVIAQNLIFNHMQVLVDGGGIYSNGIEGTSMADAELITGNVVLNQKHPELGDLHRQRHPVRTREGQRRLRRAVRPAGTELPARHLAVLLLRRLRRRSHRLRRQLLDPGGSLSRPDLTSAGVRRPPAARRDRRGQPRHPRAG